MSPGKRDEDLINFIKVSDQSDQRTEGSTRREDTVPALDKRLLACSHCHDGSCVMHTCIPVIPVLVSLSEASQNHAPRIVGRFASA
jgi:hypothetical protein